MIQRKHVFQAVTILAIFVMALSVSAATQAESFTGWDLGDVPRCVILVQTENVIVNRGGNSFKVEVSADSKENYELSDYIHESSNKREVVLERKSDLGPDAVWSPSITVTIPKNAKYQLMDVYTSTGNITISNTQSEKLTAVSDSGNINLSDCKASEMIIAESPGGIVSTKNVSAPYIAITDKNRLDDVSGNDVDFETEYEEEEDNQTVNDLFQQEDEYNNASDFQEKMYRDNDNSIHSINIDSEAVDVVLKEVDGNVFTASLSYDSNLEVQYASAEIEMSTENGIFEINIAYPNGEITQTECEDLATLNIEVPQKQYDNVRVSLKGADRSVTIPVSADTVELYNQAGDVDFNLPYQCNNLILKNCSGDLDLKVSYLPQNTSITTYVGDINYYLPDDVFDIEVSMKENWLGDAIFPSDWNYINKPGDIKYFKRGNQVSRINGIIDIGSVSICV